MIPVRPWRFRESPQGPLTPCPVCAGLRHRIIGVRGNREHSGASPAAAPHLWTNVVACRDCEFVFANPRIPEAADLELRHYADAEHYVPVVKERTNEIFDRRLHWIERYGAKGRLLDVGAGTGEFLARARARGWDGVGVEPSPTFASVARERSGGVVHDGTLDANEHLLAGDFDVVTLSHVLEHVASPVSLLGTVAASLRPTGLLFVEVPNVGSTMADLIDVYFRLRGRDWSCRLSPVHPPFHSYGYNERSLGEAMTRAGFDVVAVETFSGTDRLTAASLVGRARGLAVRLVDSLGNRDLLAMLARPRRQSS